MECDASGGTFTLTFDGAETDSIDYDADEATIVSALEELSTISNVDVTFAAGVSQACQAYPSAVGFDVSFLEVPDYRGDVPVMTSNIDNLEVRIGRVVGGVGTGSRAGGEKGGYLQTEATCNGQVNPQIAVRVSSHVGARSP